MKSASALPRVLPLVLFALCSASCLHQPAHAVPYLLGWNGLGCSGAPAYSYAQETSAEGACIQNSVGKYYNWSCTTEQGYIQHWYGLGDVDCTSAPVGTQWRAAGHCRDSPSDTFSTSQAYTCSPTATAVFSYSFDYVAPSRPTASCSTVADCTNASIPFIISYSNPDACNGTIISITPQHPVNTAFGTCCRDGSDNVIGSMVGNSFEFKRTDDCVVPYQTTSYACDSCHTGASAFLFVCPAGSGSCAQGTKAGFPAPPHVQPPALHGVEHHLKLGDTFLDISYEIAVPLTLTYLVPLTLTCATPYCATSQYFVQLPPVSLKIAGSVKLREFPYCWYRGLALGVVAMAASVFGPEATAAIATADSYLSAACIVQALLGEILGTFQEATDLFQSIYSNYAIHDYLNRAVDRLNEVPSCSDSDYISLLQQQLLPIQLAPPTGLTINLPQISLKRDAIGSNKKALEVAEQNDQQLLAQNVTLSTTMDVLGVYIGDMASFFLANTSAEVTEPSEEALTLCPVNGAFECPNPLLLANLTVIACGCNASSWIGSSPVASLLFIFDEASLPGRDNVTDPTGELMLSSLTTQLLNLSSLLLLDVYPSATIVPSNLNILGLIPLF